MTIKTYEKESQKKNPTLAERVEILEHNVAGHERIISEIADELQLLIESTSHLLKVFGEWVGCRERTLAEQMAHDQKSRMPKDDH